MNVRLPTQEQVRYHGERWIWVPALALLAFLLFPSSSIDVAPLLEPGRVADRDVIAPFTFSVNKTDQELAREAEELAATVKPIYEFEQRALDSAAAAMHVFFARIDAAAGQGPAAVTRAARDLGVALTPQEASYLGNGKKRRNVEAALADLFEHTLALGVTGPGVLQVEQSPDLIIRRRTSETAVARDQVLSYAQYLARARAAHPDKGSAAGDAVYVRLAGHFFRPTLVPNTVETERRRDELRRSVDPTKYVVRAGERIIGAHEVVTSEAHERLGALQQELLRRGAATSRSGLGVLGPILRDSLVLGIFWVLLLFYRRETYREPRQVALVGSLFAAAIVGAAVIARWVPQHPVLVPLPFTAIRVPGRRHRDRPHRRLEPRRNAGPGAARHGERARLRRARAAAPARRGVAHPHHDRSDAAGAVGPEPAAAAAPVARGPRHLRAQHRDGEPGGGRL